VKRKKAPETIAQGIAAEIPQDLHGQIRGIGAESPAGRIFVSATRIQKYCSPMQPGSAAFYAANAQKF
jgi:hypothetical protein